MIIYYQRVRCCDPSNFSKERRIISCPPCTCTYLHSIISHSHNLVNEKNAVSSCDLLGNGPQRICRAKGQCGNREDRLGQHDGRPRRMAILSIGRIYGAFQDSQSSPASATTTLPEDAGPAKHLNTWPADGTTRFVEGMGGFPNRHASQRSSPQLDGSTEHGPLTRDRPARPMIQWAMIQWPMLPGTREPVLSIPGTRDQRQWLGRSAASRLGMLGGS